jgi:DNA-binding transcriptional LysR family regulator
VASGPGIALVPESVLDTVQHATVARYRLPKVHGERTTPLIWRAADPSPALLALRKIASAAAR